VSYKRTDPGLAEEKDARQRLARLKGQKQQLFLER